MKDSSGNIKQYTAEDIRRYVQNEMSPAEMHAIEKAALEDPFLADAIEGFSSGVSEHGLASVEKSAVNLQTAFAERIKGKKTRNVVPVVGMKWWQAAVAASIIITAGVLGYRSYTDRTDELLLTVNEPTRNKKEAITVDSAQPEASKAQLEEHYTIRDTAKAEESQDNKPEVRPVENTASKQSRIYSADDNKKKAAAANENNGLITTPTNERAIATNQKNNATSQKTNALNEKDIAVNEKAVATDDKELVTAKRASEAAVPQKKSEVTELRKEVPVNLQVDSTESKAPAPLEVKLSGKVAGVDFESSRATSANQSPLNYFNGQIVTSDNKPLSNAVLKLSNNATVYTTDNNGKFRIASPDSVIEVEASMVGRETTRFRLQKDDEANNLLLPDAVNSLNEVVVIGYGTKRKKDITGSVTVSRREAEPEGGWLVWDKYLQTNKDSTLVLNGTAETEISFQVTAKNKLSQFRIIRSISAKHDQEVIRLIKEGPKWNLRKGKKATVTITMRF